MKVPHSKFMSTEISYIIKYTFRMVFFFALFHLYRLSHSLLGMGYTIIIEKQLQRKAR